MITIPNISGIWNPMAASGVIMISSNLQMEEKFQKTATSAILLSEKELREI